MRHYLQFIIIINTLYFINTLKTIWWLSYFIRVSVYPLIELQLERKSKNSHEIDVWTIFIASCTDCTWRQRIHIFCTIEYKTVPTENFIFDSLGFRWSCWYHCKTFSQESSHSERSYLQLQLRVGDIRRTVLFTFMTDEALWFLWNPIYIKEDLDPISLSL